ncbi:MAG: hypothetical protein OEN20_11060 [Gammaproteobacteria bacterium]|nr:hypothetical protein [Gammaproteobacteria bacterium]
MLHTLLWLCASLACAANVVAGELNVTVRDAQGTPLPNAVVSVELLDPAPPSLPVGESQTAIISQKSEQFEPFVSVVQTSTVVSFPNQDDILHNVYSFSKAKKFQLPLYRDQAPPPVVFDKPGTVILGCNIHDWMVAYVYVLDTPHFAKTSGDGAVELTELPAGRYRVQVFHPRKRKRGSTPAPTLDISQHQPVAAEFVIALKPEWRPRQGAAQQDNRD